MILVAKGMYYLSISVEDDYLNAEPMYNNLEAMWRQNQHAQKKKEVDAFSQEFDLRMKIGSSATGTAGNASTTNQNSLRSSQNSGNNGDNRGAGSENLRSNGNSLRESQRSHHSSHHHSSTMPRPASIQPTMHHSTRFVIYFSYQLFAFSFIIWSFLRGFDRT